MRKRTMIQPIRWGMTLVAGFAGMVSFASSDSSLAWPVSPEYPAGETRRPSDEAQETVPPPLAGYATYADMETRLQALAESPWVELKSLGETLGQRQVWVLKIASDPAENRPAILILGNVHGPHVVGRELALRMAERLVQSAGDAGLEKLLAQYTVYVIPSPTPDATEKQWSTPFRERLGNQVATDDDRDFEIGEDGPVDLNGDGWITWLRIEEPFGTHRLHPADSRVLIEVDSKKQEAGQYRLIVEGRDQDGDESIGEDAGDGVEFNRNFTFNYPYFGRGAGPHQVSEVETRAIADFMYDHPNIAFVYGFSPEDNLFHPWKGSSQTDGGRIKSKVLTSDQRHFERLAEQFRAQHGGKDQPATAEGAGSFSEWSYFHYGRWSLFSRGWWIPAVEKAETPSESTPPSEGAEQQSASETASVENATAQEGVAAKPVSPPLDKDDKRGADDLKALAWFEAQGVEGFVPWQRIEHPDFPDKVVEVGGFKPLYRLNPPVDQVDPLVQSHLAFLGDLVQQWPRIEIQDLEVKSLGGGLYDVRCQLVNSGQLPTMPEMAAVNGQWHPIQVRLVDVGPARWIQGSPRQSVRRLSELGGKAEVRWVFQLDEIPANEPTWKVRAESPTLHSVELESVVTPQQD